MSTILAAIFGGGDDEDDPFTTQEKFEQSVMSILGPELGGIVLRGAPGTLLGVDLTNRVGMPDLWFRAPNKDLQTGQDVYYYYLSQIAGAPPAVAGMMLQGWDQFSKGQVERGFETIAPKAFKDLLKANRFLWEGVQTPYGETVISKDDTGYWAVIAQALGFTPAHIAEKWDQTSMLKDAENRIKVNRAAYINSFAMARILGDQAGVDAALEKIRHFNASQYGRTMPIRGSSLAGAVKGHFVREAKRERGGGVLIQNEALSQALHAGAPESVY